MMSVRHRKMASGGEKEERRWVAEGGKRVADEKGE
jgi:hypothetical protein